MTTNEFYDYVRNLESRFEEKVMHGEISPLKCIRLTDKLRQWQANNVKREFSKGNLMIDVGKKKGRFW